MSYATSVIKNIQTGNTAIGASSTSATATITAVDTAKATTELRITGSYAASSGDAPWTVTLTDTTTVTVTKSTNNNAATVPWTCVEYY